MRFTISGGLFRAAYYGAIGSQAAYNHIAISNRNHRLLNILHKFVIVQSALSSVPCKSGAVPFQDDAENSREE
jgi:hypothetical protein